MKWSTLAAVAMLTLTAAASAAEPREGFGTANWWARYGVPVSHGQPAAVAPVIVEPATMPAHSSYGYDYVYHPGICDYSPPCTDWLWAGYSQNPKRCHPHSMYPRCQVGCGTCGSCASCGQAAGNCGCTAAVGGAPAYESGKPALSQPQPLPEVDAADRRNRMPVVRPILDLR